MGSTSTSVYALIAFDSAGPRGDYNPKALTTVRDLRAVNPIIMRRAAQRKWCDLCECSQADEELSAGAQQRER